MNFSHAFVIKNLFKKFKKFPSLLRFFSKDDQSTIQGIPDLEENLKNLDFFSSLHYSWFIPALRSFDTKEKYFFLSLFDSSTIKKLSSLLEIPPKNIPCKGVAKKYLQEILLSGIIGDAKDLLPIDFLPAHQLNTLLFLSKKELLALIDNLTLYDLKTEMQSMVSSVSIKKMQEIFPMEFIKKAQLIKKEKQDVVFPPLHLEKYLEEPNKLRSLLHKRGIFRLAIGLKAASFSLSFYIAHKLDMGRGTLLLSLREKNVKEEVSKNMIDVIVKLVEATSPTL